MILAGCLAPSNSGLYSPVVFSHGVVDEGKFPFECFTETTALSTSVIEDNPQHIWRGISSLQPIEKILFTEEIKVKTSELPPWRPHVTIDEKRLERVNGGELV
jgi:hypothetical protein